MKNRFFSGVLALFVLALILSFGTPNSVRRGTFTIKNNSDWTITEVYFDVEDGSTSWGDDQLEGTIAPGGSLMFYNIPEGEYGILVRDDSGDTCIHRHIPIGGGDDWSWDFDNTECGDE